MSQATRPVDLAGTQLLKCAFAYWFRRFGSWQKAMALPLVLLMASYLGFHQLTGVEQASWLMRIARSIAEAGILTLFAVAWHRHLVMGEEPRLLSLPGVHHLRFFLWLALIQIVGMLLWEMAPDLRRSHFDYQGLPWPFVIAAQIAVLVVILYLVGKVSVLFPALAVREPLSLSQAWRMTWDQGMAIFNANFLLIIAMLLIVLGLGLLATQSARLLLPLLLQAGESAPLVPLQILLELFVALYLAIVTIIACTLAVGIATRAYVALR